MMMMYWIGEGNHNAAMIMKEMQCINLVLSTQQIGYFYSSVHLIILAVCNRVSCFSQGAGKKLRRETHSAYLLDGSIHRFTLSSAAAAGLN